MAKTLAALNLPKPAATVCAIARSIVTAMTDHPRLASPSPSLAMIMADVQAVEAANAEVLTRTKGTREARDAKLDTLREDLAHLKAWVQVAADLDPTTAAALIESSGMSVKRPSLRHKLPFEARQGAVSGTVDLIAKCAGDRAGYEWQLSNDQKTWVAIRSTIQSSTLVTGLTPSLTYYFRLSVLTKDGPGDFGQVVALLVR
jgi:hypothetical protein